MKKILSALLVFTSIFTLTGCFFDEENDTPNEELTHEEILEFCNSSKSNRDDEKCYTLDDDDYKKAYSRYEDKEHLKLSEFIGEDSDKLFTNLDESYSYMIYMYAGWCPHCQENIDNLDSLITEKEDHKFFFINTDEFAINNIDIADFSSLIDVSKTDSSILGESHQNEDGTIKVTSVPTALIIKNGELVIIGSGTTLDTLKTHF